MFSAEVAPESKRPTTHVISTAKEEKEVGRRNIFNVPSQWQTTVVAEKELILR